MDMFEALQHSKKRGMQIITKNSVMAKRTRVNKVFENLNDLFNNSFVILCIRMFALEVERQLP